MRRLKENSATGPDGLPASLLKRIATSIAPNITTILNHSLSCSAFPNSWKKANITPIWKEKGSKVDVGNYRPISVTPIIARLFERFCAKQLSTYCEAHQIIPVQQFGFRPKSSCELALLHALDHWIKDIDSGRFVGALLIDLSKAFDSVSHQLLINDLADIGCTPPTVNWFLNYLSNRVQKVVDPRNNTSWSLVTKGVPQGSCLSPLLFNIFLRNLPVATQSNVIQYADDITDYLSDSNPILVAKGLEASFNRIKEYCITRELNINATKTQCILFKIPNKKLPEDFEIVIDGLAIKPSQSVNLLCVTLD